MTGPRVAPPQGTRPDAAAGAETGAEASKRESVIHSGWPTARAQRSQMDWLLAPIMR